MNINRRRIVRSCN